jgi:tripartite-type tricarboxylate transporter receptor subunit TctC
MMLAEAGRVRSRATTGGTRCPAMPALPTKIEAGVPGFVADAVVGLVARAATPPGVGALLNREIAAIRRRPDIVAAWAEQGADPNPPNGAAEWGGLLAKDVARWQQLIPSNVIQSSSIGSN